MTLIAGFRCNDGFVLAADTEIGYGPITFQNSKLQRYWSDRYGYSLFIGGAGDVSYFVMAAQKIRDAVAEITNPTLSTIKAAVDTTISEVHDKYIFKNWAIDANDRPTFDLIIGVHDGNRDDRDNANCMILRSDDIALVEVKASASDFIGSGSYVAQLVAERLITPGLSTAVTMHLAGQVFREVKGKGEAVGGNTEIYGMRTRMSAEPFFDLSAKDYRFLWGLEGTLLGGIREALVKDRNFQISERIQHIENTLRLIRADAEKPRDAAADEQHIIEFGTEYGNPYEL